MTGLDKIPLHRDHRNQSPPTPLPPHEYAARKLEAFEFQNWRVQRSGAFKVSEFWTTSKFCKTLGISTEEKKKDWADIPTNAIATCWRLAKGRSLPAQRLRPEHSTAPVKA